MMYRSKTELARQLCVRGMVCARGRLEERFVDGGGLMTKTLDGDASDGGGLDPDSCPASSPTES